MAKLAVIAIGGNSIIKPGEAGTIEQQWNAADETCRQIAKVIEMGYRVILTHGNGPQVGNILFRSELAKNQLPTLPLDVCGADAQGAMGYMLQQLLDRELKFKGLKRSVITIITQIIVDRKDQAFDNPSKPIGPFYTLEEAERHRLEDHWYIVEDAGRGYRRAVPSPMPISIVESDVIADCVEKDYILICLGGGGIPVMQKKDGSYEGCAAVVDKDYASSLLAKMVNADLFIITTSVDKVFLNFGSAEQAGIEHITTDELKQYIDNGEFCEGSMLPKVKAAISFVEESNNKAIITSPENLIKAINGKEGTHIFNN